MCKFFCTFVPVMRKYIFFIAFAAVLTACNKPSKVEQYRAEKHVRDSVALIEQQRSLVYYEQQLELLMPKADSLLPLFHYEKNEKYQDQGWYVVRNEKLKAPHAGLRVMVRDDGKELLIYRNGKRTERIDDPAVERAEHLQILISDIKELEKRIHSTSLEVQKYENRLQKHE